MREPLSALIEQTLTAAICESLGDYQAILIADYAKGCCTPKLLRSVLDEARRTGIPVLIDPGRGRELALYRGATLLKPNRREAEALTGLTISTPEDALPAARILCETGDVDMAVVTLDRTGMVYAGNGGQSGHMPTTVHSVCDITGAGDMALAALGFATALDWPIREAVELANRAAGLETQRLGIEPISRHDLEAATSTTRERTGKIRSLAELLPLVEEIRRQGRRIVFTNGCFDLLHAGHLRCLAEARALGDVLIVAINSDAGVRRLKGLQRPIVSERERADLLAALGCVDYVTIFDDPTPHRLLAHLQPDILAKGGTTGEIVGQEVVEAYGGRVIFTGRVEGRSTTQLVGLIREALPQ